MVRFFLFLVTALLASVAALFIACGNFMAIGSFIMTADPLVVLCLIALALAVSSFVAGLISADYSWVDRLWSTAPVAFVWFYAWRGGFAPVLLIPAILVSLWGARLTFNFARKGGYAGTEDYRWAILRERIRNPLAWQAFNLGFISCYQIGLFLLFTAPMYAIWLQTQSAAAAAPNPAFWIACVALAGFILIEGIADNQQWRFYRAREAKKTGADIGGIRFFADIERGFLSSGLFAHSRHPNYFGEIMVWWALYAASAALGGGIFNYSLIGPVLLTILFIGSTAFTEGISAAKYPAYQAYQKSTSPIIPWFSKRLP